jgi:D-alanine-D-alanine ligase
MKTLMPSPDVASRSGRVAVLMGGTAAEREVSLTSGRFVLEALLAEGVDAFKVDIGNNPLQQILELEADRAFNILHGRGGEDGCIQALLEAADMPYVGNGIKASAVTMDKLMTKRLALGAGIATPDFRVVRNARQALQAGEALGYPVIVKPVLEGSSIGMSKVRRASEMAAAYERASDYGAVMVEAWVEGSEYTVSWIDGQALPAICIETPHEIYDYEAKYVADSTQYHCPCGLSEAEEAELQALACRCAEVCDLRHWGRVDFMRNGDGHFLMIEVNTVPGMTDHSLVPMAARQAGLSFRQLVMKLLELSLQDKKEAER